MVALARAVSIEASVVIMDEPTSSLEASEVETLFGVVDVLRRRGVSIVYISHRIEELYRLCDDVTVLRDGRLIHHGALADLSRIELISLMLGRETGQVEASGRTTFTERRRVAEGEPALVATGLTRSPMLDGVSVSVRPGEVVGLGGLMGSGAIRDGQSHPRRARRRRRERDRARSAGPPAQSPSGRQAGHRDAARGSQGRRDHPGSLGPGQYRPAAVPASRGVAWCPEPTRPARRGLHGQAADQGLRPRPARLPALRWQPAEGAPGQAAVPGPQRPALDEPTRGIDVGAKAEVQRLVDELADNGLGVMLISSDLRGARRGRRPDRRPRAGSVVEELSGDRCRRTGWSPRWRPPGWAQKSGETRDDRARRLAASGAPPTARQLQDYGVYAAVVLIVLVNVVFTPNFLDAGNIRTQLLQVAPVVIVALEWLW